MAENILQLFADDNKTIKGYPITSAKLVIRENGRSMEDFDKDMVAKQDMLQRETEKSLKDYVDKIPTNIVVSDTTPTERRNFLHILPEELVAPPELMAEEILKKVNNTTSQLAEKAKQSEVRFNNVKIDLQDFSDTAKQAIAGTTPINSTPYGRINGAYTPHNTYQHSRGDSEMIGESTFQSGNKRVVGYYEKIINYTVFNRFDAYVYNTFEDDGLEYKIFIRDNSNTFNPSIETPIANGSIPASQCSHTNETPTKLRLETPVFLQPNKYLFVFFKATAGGTAFRVWKTNTTSDRHGFLFSIGDAGQTWNNTFALSSGLDYQASYKLFMENEELRNYTPPTPEIPIVPEPEPTRIILPTEINAVVGEKTQIFLRGIIENVNPYLEPIKATCNIGRLTTRYIELEPTAEADSILTLEILDKSCNVKNTATTTIKAVSPKGQPSSNTNTLVVGDSLIGGGEVATELHRRLKLSGGSPSGKGYKNITFIGNKSNEAGVKWVGYGGWTWDSYNTNMPSTNYWITVVSHDKDVNDQQSLWLDSLGRQWQLETIETTRLKFKPYGHTSSMPNAPSTLTSVNATHTSTLNYTAIQLESGNPFWNLSTGKVDFANFCSNVGASGIDICYIMLGWNQLGGANKYLASNHTSTISSAKTFINNLRASYPNCEVRILGLQVPSPHGGLGANYGLGDSIFSNYYPLLRSVNGLNLAYQDLANEVGYSSFVKYLGVASCFDSEYNMPYNNAYVNSRNATITEQKGSNGVHPAIEGYYQIADVAFRDFIRTYCS